MNTTHPRKRLTLDTETVRVLAADELTPVIGGVAAGDEPAAWPNISLSVSVGGNCNCCNTAA
jgi:hypothetical protein